jgi:hypothetical protein
LAHQSGGGFELALAEMQVEYLGRRDAATKQSVDRFQAAVSKMFPDMNRGFDMITDFEPAPSAGWPSRREIPRTAQPIFKLHGSSNLISNIGGELLIIGGNKSDLIQSHAILRWYREIFIERLNNLSLWAWTRFRKPKGASKIQCEPNKVDCRPPYGVAA